MAEEKEKFSYSKHIDKLREDNPHSNTDKYIEGLIKDAQKKGEKNGYGSGFWNGFWIGVGTLGLIWIVLTL